MKDGFIMLSRKFFENDIWKVARTYNDSEAWLDLIQSARFEASEITSRVGGRDITWRRGQYPASVRFLASRWRWSEQKVRTFLGTLKRKGMVTTEHEQGMNIITLVNYDDYNGGQRVESCANNTPNMLDIKELSVLIARQLTHGVEGQHTPNTKNNKDNNINSLYTACADERIFDKPLHECYEELMNNLPWIEQFVMNLHSSGYKEFTPDMLLLRMNDFFRELQNRGEIVKSSKEAQKHFANWLKKELKENNEGKRTANPRTASRFDECGGQKKTSVPTADKEPDTKAQNGYSSRF